MGREAPALRSKKVLSNWSEKSQRPIVPIRARPQSYYMFKKSWSHIKLPLPFSKVDLHFGEAKSLYCAGIGTDTPTGLYLNPVFFY